MTRAFIFRLFAPARRAKMLAEDGRCEEAMRVLEKMALRNPHSLKAWHYMGVVSLMCNQVEAAVRASQKAAALAPKDPRVLLTLAESLVKNLEYGVAMEVYRRFPANIENKFSGRRLLGLGIAQKRQGDFDSAYETFLGVAEIYPKLAERAWTEAASIGWDCEKEQKILDLARKANPSPEFLIKSELHLPRVPFSKNDLDRQRARIGEKLRQLTARKVVIARPDELVSIPLFGFNYVLDDPERLRLRCEYAEFLRKACPGLEQVDPGVSSRIADFAPRRLRLGLAVPRYDEEISSKSMAGLIRALNRELFEVVLIGETEDKANAHVVRLNRLADSTVACPTGNWGMARKRIADAELDILLHINCPSFLYAGFSRLAPVQCAFMDPIQSMGGPNTDYTLVFGKKDWIRGWSDLFKEKLGCIGHDVLLPDLRSVAPGAAVKDDFGVPGSARILFTWQPLFRWRVEDDLIIARLLRDNQDLWLVVIVYPPDESYPAVLKRWRTAMPDVMGRINIMPYQPFPKFLALLRLADAVIAPPYCPGMLSLATALCSGVPMAVYFGTGQQARIAPLAYEVMGVDGLTARSLEEYGQIVQRLLDDQEWRKAKSEEILEKLPSLYRIEPYVRELEDFLLAAHQRAREGKEPRHWCDGQFIE